MKRSLTTALIIIVCLNLAFNIANADKQKLRDGGVEAAEIIVESIRTGIRRWNETQCLEIRINNRV